MRKLIYFGSGVVYLRYQPADKGADRLHPSQEAQHAAD
jgi:hypothetical protein